MPGRRNLSPHSQPHPPLFYNNKIYSVVSDTLKKSYQHGKEFIIYYLLGCLLIGVIPIASVYVQFIQLLRYRVRLAHYSFAMWAGKGRIGSRLCPHRLSVFCN